LYSKAASAFGTDCALADRVIAATVNITVRRRTAKKERIGMGSPRYCTVRLTVVEWKSVPLVPVTVRV
jgi:hypothetical protein